VALYHRCGYLRRRGSAYQKELLIKQWLRQTVGTLPRTTEAWSTASLEVQSMVELFDLVGLDNQAGNDGIGH
jgi:hypothetical protein